VKADVGPGVQAIVIIAIVGFLLLLMSGLCEVGLRVEKRRGAGSPLPIPNKPRPHFLMLQWLQVYLDQPDARARVRNISFVLGLLAVAPYIALVVYNRG
jgi:hypothetical protein